MGRDVELLCENLPITVRLIEHQLEWVRRMNSIRNRAEEIIKTEVIFV